MNKNTICLWFSDDAEEAAKFYSGKIDVAKIEAAVRG